MTQKVAKIGIRAIFRATARYGEICAILSGCKNGVTCYKTKKRGHFSVYAKSRILEKRDWKISAK